jgi:small subunit ribosomal protein S20
MRNSRTVRKRQRQTVVRQQRNKSIRSGLRTLERKVRSGSTTDVDHKAVQSSLDKAANKGVIHPNKAARKKSRLAKLAGKTSAS